MLAQLFWTTLVIGSLSFGGGYAIISLLQYNLVSRTHMLSAEEFVDGIAVGQMTPGPLLIMAAFMGYRIAGLPGAVVALTGLFLPAFVAVIALAAFYERIHAQPRVEHALRGVTVAVTGLLAAVVVGLIPHVGPHLVPSLLIATAVFVLVVTTEIEPVALVLAGALAGLLFLR